MPDDSKFLTDIQSEDADIRFAAWRSAGEASPAVIPQLGKLASSSTPGVAKAAREALTTMTHSVGKSAAGPNRAAVVKGLLGLLAASYELPVRVHAFRLLSGIAGEDAVPAIAKSLADPQLREEAIYCLERIPGDASAKAILAAYTGAPDEFKPRILAALGHRRVPEASTVAANAMRASNKEIAVAGARAFGRIGKRPASGFREPDVQGLSEWQKIEITDSMLRYADIQAAEGNAAEAIRVYRSALERPEEHWQCAAVIGLSKIGSAEAAALILPKLKSPDRIVRATAANAWKSMAGKV